MWPKSRDQNKQRPSGPTTANAPLFNRRPVKTPHPPIAGKTIPASASSEEGSASNKVNQNYFSEIEHESPDECSSVTIKTAKQAGHTAPYSNKLERKIPATKFTISKNAASVFQNPKLLEDEIIKHKSINKNHIKKAFLYGNTVIIATDDPNTKQILEEDWPSDAFQHGVKALKKGTENAEKTVRMVIFAKQAHIDLECQETKDQLLEQGITEATHLTSKVKSNGFTGIIKANVINKEKAESLLLNKVKIGFSIFKAQYDVRILQCYNCAKFGHHAANCRNRPACINCAGNHLLKDCPNKLNKEATKCANCGMNHYACSRSCKAMENAIENRLVKISPSFSQAVSNKINNQARSFLKVGSNGLPLTYSQATQSVTSNPHTATLLLNKVEALEDKYEDLTVNLTHQLSQQQSQIEEISNHTEQKLSVVIKCLTESIAMFNNSIIQVYKALNAGPKMISTVENKIREITSILTNTLEAALTKSPNDSVNFPLRLSNSGLSSTNNDASLLFNNV